MLFTKLCLDMAHRPHQKNVVAQSQVYVLASPSNVNIYIHVFTQLLSHVQDATQSTASLNLEFSFFEICCLFKAKETSLPYYLCIAEVRQDRFMHFSRSLALSEMHSTSSRIWTESFLCNENHFAKHASPPIFFHFILFLSSFSLTNKFFIVILSLYNDFIFLYF